MQPFSLSTTPAGRPLRVVAIGCHADDIEIGCGGTLLTLVERRPEVEVTWIVLSADGERRREAEASARVFLAGAATVDLRVESFRDGFFPHRGEEVKDWFETLKSSVDPDVIFTHSRHDRHQDHRLVSELTWNTFRRHLILEYEIPKYDGDLGSPNVFVPIDPKVARRKAELIGEHFGSQSSKHWFDDELLLSLLRIRGVEASPPTRYAEAFYGRKLSLVP
jgi:LmbE family N-acetylglucosaminyl deacetylase